MKNGQEGNHGFSPDGMMEFFSYYFILFLFILIFFFSLPVCKYAIFLEVYMDS